MARRCEHCGKGPRSGNRVSHANNRTRMRQLPNLQTVRLNENGRTVTRRLCTRCIRNGGYVKAV